jgi:hypothetical protein
LSYPVFPVPARVFLALSTPARSRIFLLDEGVYRNAPTALTSVATVSGPADVGELIRTLNHAAATGDRAPLSATLEGLPDAVVQAIDRALDSCPDPSSLVLDIEGRPMTVLRESYHRSNSDELVLQANSAMNLGLQYLIRNSIDEEGSIEFAARLLSDEAQVRSTHDWTWWAAEGLTLSERLKPHPRELANALADPRWETNVGRAYWLWIEDSHFADDAPETSATAQWVVEFYEQPLDPDTNFRIFQEADEVNGYLTERNRFLLWRSLWNIAVDLDGALSDADAADDVQFLESVVRDDMPSITHGQPRAWWELLRDAADRLCEAARIGDITALRPRTVGEEALIALAVRSDYIGWARDSFEMADYQQIFDSLPTSTDDGDWGEILPALTGDIDVEMLWQPHLDGIDDPANDINMGLGIGDYRPAAWHSLFDRAKGDD